MDTLKSQGTKAFFWDFSGKIAMHGMTFIVAIFLARLLEPSDFGLIAMVMVLFGMAGIFSDIGLSEALVQRKRVLDIHYSSVFYFNMSMASLLSVISFLFAPYIADFYNHEELLLLVEVISISFIFNALNSVHVAQFRKHLNFKILTQITFIASLFGGVIGIILAFQGLGVWSLVVQQLSASILTTLLVWKASSWRPQLLFSFKALFQLWNFGLRMFLAALLDKIFSRLDVLVIAKMFPPAILGFFQRAKSLEGLVISYGSGSLVSVLFPVLSKVKNNLPQFQNIIIKSLGIICFLTFFLLGILFLISEELIIILFSEKWLVSVNFFQILVLSGFAYPVSALLVNILSSRGNSRAFLKLEVYKKILLAINLYIGFLWGIEGYLYGLIIVSIFAVYLNILFASDEIAMSQTQFIKPIIIQGVLTILIGIFLYYLNLNLEYSHILMLLIKGLEFSFLYIGINYFFKIQSYQYFMEQFMPLLKSLEERVKNDS